MPLKKYTIHLGADFNISGCDVFWGIITSIWTPNIYYSNADWFVEHLIFSSFFFLFQNHDIIDRCEKKIRFADNAILVLFFAFNFWNSRALRAQPDRSFIFQKAMCIANLYKIPVLAVFYYYAMDPTDPIYFSIFILYEACVHIIVYSGIIISNFLLIYRNPFYQLMSDQCFLCLF